MLRYVIRRLLLLPPTILAIMFMVFGILSLTPGTPGRLILGPVAKQEAVDKLDEEFGFNRPFLVRFADYAVKAVQGDFGVSYTSRRPVFDEVFARFPTTLKLSLLCVISAAILGIPLGILSAVKQYSLTDVLGTSIAMFMATVPGFWLGLMLLLLFSLRLGLLPSGGIGTWQHYVLPTLTMSLPVAAGLLRMTRTTMLEAIRQDYVRTARAKGATERRVIWGHALKNALLPVVTTLGVAFGGMLGGTVLIESVFTMPGLGTLVINAIRQKDIPLVTGTVLFLSVLFYLIMFVVDILYAYIDPRIRAQYER